MDPSEKLFTTLKIYLNFLSYFLFYGKHYVLYKAKYLLQKPNEPQQILLIKIV